jgi:chromosome segregation ATPase
MYNNFIDKYSDLKRTYVNLMKDSKRIYEENDNMERKYNEMCDLYDEISLKLAKAIIKINRLESENKELKINLEKIVEVKCPLCEFNLNKMNGWKLEDL